MGDKSSEKSHIVPFISDYGFKVTFADEHSLFAKKAIELLAELDSPIERIEMLRNEFLGMTAESRAGVFDVFCRDEQKRLFIIEMQATEYDFFEERILFYIFHLYNTMVKKGEQGFDDLQPIYCICIVENRITAGRKYDQKFTFRSEEGAVFYDKIEIHLIELGKFNIKRKDYSKIKTEKEELIYTMKYGHKIDLRESIHVPPFWKKEWIDEAIAKLDQRNMTPEEYALMEIGIFQINLIHYQQQKLLESAQAKGEARGEVRGEARAKVEAEAEKLRLKTEAVKRMILLGLTDENIALVLQETPEFVNNIRAEMPKE